MAELVLQKEQRTTQFFNEILNNDVGIDMVKLPAGDFLMGSPADESRRTKAEGPQYRVIISEFYFGRFPVTQIQWKVVSHFKKYKIELNPDPSYFKGDNRPVETVTWDEAVEFCDRLRAHTGRNYRLPSEAEWEYACRAGTDTPFFFGQTLSTDLANYDGNYIYGPGKEGEYRQQTTPVDFFELANGFGLHDMHGNVDEWCQDRWHASYKGAPNDGRAWIDSKRSNGRRVVRGGSWDPYPRNCRSAFRFHYYPGDSGNALGFRVACGAPRT